MLRSGIVLDYAPLVPSDLEDTRFILQVEAVAILAPRAKSQQCGQCYSPTSLLAI